MPGMICQLSNFTVLADNTIVSASNTESSTTVLRDKHLSTAIFYEAENHFRDAQGKNMRFSNFLYSKLLPLCSPLVHKSAKSLLEEVKNYSRLCISDRLQILNKVSFLMGYGSVDDLIGHERALRECACPLQEGPGSSLHDSDVLEACHKFSSIVLGSSQRLDLYSAADEKSGLVDCQLIKKDMDKSTQRVVDTTFESSNITETECIGRDQSNHFAVCSVLYAEPNPRTLQLYKQDLHLSKKNRLETAEMEGLEGSAMANENVLRRKSTCKLKEATIPVNCFLDAPINTIKGILPSQRRKLEENGFHTVRKLLQHFPRTYVNMQDAEGQVEDGQLLNFFGRILSSRGRRAGFSGGIVEVIIGCQIPRTDEYCTRSDQDYKDKGKRTVYIHLKRYFRGVRFTNTWILDKLRSKYNEGDLVSVSGKAAFMVPTELLATQHYENIISMLERINKDDRPSVAFLTGSTPLKETRLIRKGLEMGDIALVVGTHKLFSESVNFASLCFAVIDEQHRFGVEQKGRFSSKACTVMDKSGANGIKLEDGQLVANKTFFAPHVLVMSATPIPRTLALTLHGNMSLSKINELPPGRIPVKTLALHGNTKGLTKTYQMVQKELDSGGRVFLVYPAIDESEQLPELHAAAAEIKKISKVFKGYKCGLLHGRMKTTEKDKAIQQFKEGKTQILLSTQVVEVGIDIPEATMMVIMNAERFGISQLHQFRGRVGRGTGKSTCILVSSSAVGLPRLKILQQSMDGFELAEADLHLRGPGSLLGTRQSGHLPEFSIARLQTDGDVLEKAHFAALDILQQHPCLDSLPMLKAEISMRHPLNSLGA